jgi:uncharacterized protein (DUF885 family)
MDPSKRLEKLERDFFKEWLHRHPLLGTGLGLHEEFDERMPDGTLEKELDDIRCLHQVRAEAEKIDPRKLAPLQAVERDVFLRALGNWIFDRETLKIWERCPEAPQVIGHSLFQILSRNYAPLGLRMRSIVRRLEKMPKYIDQSRSRLRRPVKLFIEIELETITRLPGFFNLLKDIGREHLPATPQRDLNRLIEQVQNTLQRYEDWLIVDVLPDASEDFAPGEDLFRRLLEARGIDASPAGTLAAADAEILRLKERQREVARAIRRKVPIEDVRDMLKQQHPENFDGVLRFVRESVAKARQFTNRSHFVQLPEGEQLYVIETPMFLRHLLPFGGYWAPSRMESKLDGYFFVTPGDCDSDKLKEHNYGALSALTVREGYPGRHVQMAWAVRHASPIRAIYEDALTAGGWGHYCEERAKEMGYDDTPPARFMQMQAGVLAAARASIDVRLGTGRMTYAQAVDALIDILAMDRVCAEAEVRRTVTHPGVSAAHFWGRERLKDLKRWARNRMGARFSETFFHTALLRAGPLPPPLLKRELDLRIAEELRRPEEARKEGEAKAPAAPRRKAPARPARAGARKATRPRRRPPPRRARRPAPRAARPKRKPARKPRRRR